MYKKLLVFALILLLMTAPAYAFKKGQKQDKCKQGQSYFFQLNNLQKDLKLTDKQINQINKINLKYKKIFLEYEEKITPNMIKVKRLTIEKNVNYDEVRIKEIPMAMQCWTFRKLSFMETLEKVNKLGIKYLEVI